MKMTARELNREKYLGICTYDDSSTDTTYARGEPVYISPMTPGSVVWVPIDHTQHTQTIIREPDRAIISKPINTKKLVKYCAKCGTKVREKDQKYCERCGWELEKR